MLDAKLWLYVEPHLHNIMVSRVRYVTDMSPDPVSCKTEELRATLAEEYKFPRKALDDMRDKLYGGAVILDLINKQCDRWVGEPALIKKTVIRSPLKQKGMTDFIVDNKRIEDYVNTRLFKR